MKNFSFLLFLLLSFQPIYATHIVGGSLTCEYLGGDEYKIRLEILRDCYNGVPYFDDFASIGIFTDATLMDTLLLPFSGLDDTLSLTLPNGVCVLPPYLCVNKTIYEGLVSLPEFGGVYTITYQRCCRAQTLSNLVDPLELGLTFFTEVTPALQNSNPYFDNDVSLAVFVNTPFIYNASAIDPDGDSLVYELISPFNGASISEPQPTTPEAPPYEFAKFIDPPYSTANMLGGKYPLIIHPTTGEMHAVPSTLGVFQISYAVKEYRNGQHIGTTFREFTFVVIPIPANQNYDVSGVVLVSDGIPLDAGSVQILERDVTTDSLYVYDEQVISTDGEYSFEGIPPGVFYIQAVVDTSSQYYGNYLPTYFGSTPFWYDAIWINQCDTSQYYRDIHLVHVDSLSGVIVMDGVVFNAGRNDELAADLKLILGDKNGNAVQAQSTNGEGYFKFENLSPGVYQLFADVINSPIDNTNPPVIELTENETIQVYLYKDSLSLFMPTTSVQLFDPAQNDSIRIYPNPVNEQLRLFIHSRKAGAYSVKILNVYGQCVMTVYENRRFSEGIHVEEIDLRAISSGVFFVAVQSNDRKVIRSFIKN